MIYPWFVAQAAAVRGDPWPHLTIRIIVATPILGCTAVTPSMSSPVKKWVDGWRFLKGISIGYIYMYIYICIYIYVYI